MQTDLFGQSFTEPMKAKQIPLFHEPVQIEPPDTRTATDKKISRKFDAKDTAMLPITKTRKPTFPERVEQQLRERGIPWVNVDQVKKKLFTACKLQSFHFVVYAQAPGANWLLYCGPASAKFREDMKRWEEVFGEGYKAVFALDRAAGIVYKSLSGETLELPTKGTK